DHIRSAVAVDGIGAATAEQRICSVTAGQGVVSVTAVEQVAGRRSPCGRGERGERVVFRTAKNEIRGDVAAYDLVVAIVAEDKITRRVIPLDIVIAGTGIDGVLACKATDEIVT